MRIGFIGAGKVASAFGRYLHDRNISISGYFDPHADKLAHACQGTGSRVCSSAEQVAGCSDMVLITTRDDQIEAVCRQLSRQKAFGVHHLVGHMSGAHSSLILSEAAALGAAVFSLHPLQAFAQEDKAVSDLPHTWFSLEGADARIEAVGRILDQIGNCFFRIAPENKRLYHLSACIVSNYLVTLMDAGMAALEKSGIAPLEGFQAMLPLIQGTLANISQLGSAKALTGPVARGDATTVQHHLDALNEHQAWDLKEIYCFFGLKTLELATRDVLKEEKKAEAVRRLLQGKS